MYFLDFSDTCNLVFNGYTEFKEMLTVVSLMEGPSTGSRMLWRLQKIASQYLFISDSFSVWMPFNVTSGDFFFFSHSRDLFFNLSYESNAAIAFLSFSQLLGAGNSRQSFSSLLRSPTRAKRRTEYVQTLR
jgi:hypothetical protein